MKSHRFNIVYVGRENEFSKELIGPDSKFILLMLKIEELGANLRNYVDSYCYFVFYDIYLSSEIREQLDRYGLEVEKDYIHIVHDPVTVKGPCEHYRDEYGNEISRLSGNCTITLVGFNSKVNVETINLKKVDIEVHSNSLVSLGSSHIYNMNAKIADDCKFIMGTENKINNINIRLVRSILNIGKCNTVGSIDLDCAHGSSVSIGNDCMFSSGIKFLPHDGHSIFSIHSKEAINSDPAIVIEDHVWVGYEAIILGGTNVKEGSIIGARALLKNSFPNNVSIGGIPAKIIKTDICWSRGHSNRFSTVKGYSMITATEEIDLLDKLLNSDLSDPGICKRIYTIYNKRGDRLNYLFFLQKALLCGDVWSSIEYINELKKGEIPEQKQAFECCKNQLDIVTDVRLLNNLNITIADMYFRGIGVDKNIDLAIEHVQYAVNHGHRWSKVLLIKYLCQGNADQKNKAFQYCISYIKEWQLDRVVYAELSRILSSMYYDGECVEKNLDKAICCLRDAIEHGATDLNARLFDLLWKCGTSESLSEAYDIVKNPDTPGLKYRLGRMYHHGRHVSLNVEEAIKLYKESLDSGFIWAKDEYYEAVWEKQREGEYVLFNLNHMSALSRLVSIRFTKHANKKAILLADGIFKKSKTYQDLINCGIFDHLIEFDGKIGYQAKNVPELEILIDRYFKDLFKENKIELSSISEYYTASDLSNPFAIYLSIHKIPYYLIEIAPNQLESINRYDGAFKLGFFNESYHISQKKFGVLCGEEGFPYILYDSESTHPKANIKHNRYEIIDFNNLLLYLGDSDKQKIKNCYNLADIDSKLGAMIFPNSTGFCKGEFGIQRTDFMNVYKTMADYYCPNKEVIIKMHPNDIYNPDLDACGTMRYLNEDMPIEFFRVLDNVEIDTVVSGSASTISKIKDITRHVIYVGFDFYKAYHSLHELYVALSISNTIADDLMICTDLPYSIDFINQFARESGALLHNVQKYEENRAESICLITSSEKSKYPSNVHVIISLSSKIPIICDHLLSYKIRLIDNEELASKSKVLDLTVGTNEYYLDTLSKFSKRLKLNNLNMTLDVKKPRKKQLCNTGIE